MKQLRKNNQGLEKTGQIVSSLKMIEPRSELFSHVLQAVNRRLILIHRLRLTGVGVSALAAAGFITVATPIVISELQGSELAQLLSLLSSDSGIILANWKEYSLYFLESLPATGLLLGLSSLFLVLFIFKILIQELASGHRLTVHK